jgi:hypothetical protein
LDRRASTFSDDVAQHEDLLAIPQAYEGARVLSFSDP